MGVSGIASENTLGGCHAQCDDVAGTSDQESQQSGGYWQGSPKQVVLKNAKDGVQQRDDALLIGDGQKLDLPLVAGKTEVPLIPLRVVTDLSILAIPEQLYCQGLVWRHQSTFGQPSCEHPCLALIMTQAAHICSGEVFQFDLQVVNLQAFVDCQDSLRQRAEECIPAN